MGENRGSIWGAFFIAGASLSPSMKSLDWYTSCPDRPPPEGVSEREKEKEKRKAMDIWIIKKQIIHISTATTTTATTTVYIPRQYPCFITSRPPTPRPPPLKFEKTIKNQTTFGAILLISFESAIAYHIDIAGLVCPIRDCNCETVSLLTLSIL